MPVSKTTKQVTATKESEEKNDETAITGAAPKVEVADVKMVETTGQEDSTEKKESDLEKKTPVRKTAAKKTTRTTVKKAATKKTPEPKTEAKEEIHIQFMGKDVSNEELVNRAKEIWSLETGKKVSTIKSLQLYVKTEESMVYFVVNDDPAHTGSFSI